MFDVEKYVQISLDRDKKRDPDTVPRIFTDQHIKEGCFVMTEDKQFFSGEDIKVKMHPVCAGSFHPLLPHRHDFFEFTFVYQGKFCNIIEDQPIIQTPDHLILLNMYAKHNPYLLEEGSIVFNILIRRAAVEKVFLQLLQRNHLFFHFFLDSLYEINTPGKYLDFVLSPALKQTIEKIIEEYFERKEFYQEIMEANLLLLFSELSRSIVPVQDTGEERNSETISMVLLYMQRNYSSVTLNSVAEHFGYSARHLSRMLKNKTGHSFLQLLTQYRLRNACIYLEKSNLPTEQIALLTGFSDSSYFCKLFKRTMGMSVSEYRKSIREK